MSSSKKPQMSAKLLLSYSEAALRNADELLVEAKLLRDFDHMPRPYFLAVACIEESGKALIAFDSQNRSFSDPAICHKLKLQMEDHLQKITYALTTWARKSAEPRESIKVTVKLIDQLKRGREPSMYSDLCIGPDRVQTPREVVRASAANDAVRLAEDCLAHAHRHVKETTPPQFTSAENKLLTMKTNRFQKMMNLEDFWWYYLSCLEAGQQDFADAVVEYEQDHFVTEIAFRKAQSA